MTTAGLDAIECLSVMEDHHTEPIIKVLSKTFDSLASRKALGSDGIPP